MADNELMLWRGTGGDEDLSLWNCPAGTAADAVLELRQGDEDFIGPDVYDEVSLIDTASVRSLAAVMVKWADNKDARVAEESTDG